MKKSIFAIMLLLLLNSTFYSQSCLPNGITFTSQYQIDQFPTNYPGCTSILGSVTIDRQSITNLNGLSQITSIGGDLYIQRANITNLNGLNNLTSIGGNLQLQYLQNVTNWLPNLNSISALSNLQSVGGSIMIGMVPQLTNLNGLQGITSLSGNLTLIYSSLNSLSALSNLTSVSGLHISGCGALTNLNGLENLTFNSFYLWGSGITTIDALNFPSSFPGSITIGGSSLNNLNDISNITSVSGTLNLSFNNFPNLNGLSNLISVGNISLVNDYGLTNLQGLENLVNVTGDFSIYQNQALTSLEGINSNIFIGNKLNFYNNPQLSNCAIERVCDYLNNNPSKLNINNNKPDCNNASQVTAECNNLPPACTSISTPTPGSTEVPTSSNISWMDVTNLPGAGYYLSIGTSPGGTEILSNTDLGDVLTYDPVNNLPYNTTIYVKVTPYNLNGISSGCSEQSFTTEGPCPSYLYLANQNDVNNFPINYPDCQIINYIEITGADIVDLSPLNQITQVLNDVYIYETGLTNLNGLTNLTSVISGLYIFSNSSLTSLTGLNNLSNVGFLYIDSNPLLTNCAAEGICNIIEATPQNTLISLNSTGCNNLEEVVNACGIIYPYCTHLYNPINGSANVAVSTNLSWTSAINATGYKLSIGLVPGGTELLDNYDVANATIYDPPVNFPYLTTIFVKVIPYNVHGEATGCIEENFMTENIIVEPPNLVEISSSKIKIKYNASILPSSANNTNLRIWGDETGLRSGIYSVSLDTLIFVPDVPFRAGELVHITSKNSLQFAGGGTAAAFSWIKQSEVTNQTTASFDSFGTGIILPGPAYEYSYQATMADMNRDGLQDIIYHYYSYYGAPTNILIYLRNNDGSFAAPLNYTNSESHSAIIGTPDLNGDGYPDLVISHNVPSMVQVRLNNGVGGLGTPSFYPVTNYCNYGKIADMDNDGDLDIITYSGNASLSLNTISLLLNNGNGTFSAQLTTNTSVFGSSCVPSDLDHDGDMDILYTSNDAFGSPKVFRVYMNNGNGILTLSYNESNPMSKTISSAFNYNNDLNLDIVSGYPATDIYLDNEGINCSLNSPSIIYPVAAYALSGDLDGDGDLDIFIPNSNNGNNYNSPLIVSLNDGNGVFTNVTNPTLIMPAISIQSLSDYDGDNDLDHLYIDSGTGEIMVALNHCNRITKLTENNSPISGVYTASEMIVIEGDVEVAPNKTITLKAPIVKIKNQLAAGSTSNIIINPYPCNVNEGTINQIDCAGYSISGTLIQNVESNGIFIEIPYLGGNGGIYFGQAINSDQVNGLTATLAAGVLNVGNGTLIFNLTGTPVGYGFAQFNIDFGGQICTLNVIVKPENFICGISSISFFYNSNPVTCGTVMSAGRCWLDRNLGANQVATSGSDEASYGDLFQWGRLDDGHQVRTSQTSNVLSGIDIPGNSYFILSQNSPYDWRSPQNNDLWQGLNGINNPCPEGFRIPNENEWNAERASWNSNNGTGAFSSPLKLTLAGSRSHSSGEIYDVGEDGKYWTFNLNGTNSKYLYFGWSYAGVSDLYRGLGYSVRCISDDLVEGSIESLDCSGAVLTGTITDGIPVINSYVEISYTNSNGGTYPGQIVNSTGINGLVATLNPGYFNVGSGSINYSISGTASGSGIAIFALNTGGQQCNLSIDVLPIGIISNLNCAGAVITGTLTEAIQASGVAANVPYSGGNGMAYQGQSIVSTGVTGLIATLSSGNFSNGNGSLTFAINGTPSSSGNAIFSLNIGGQTCDLIIPVQPAGNQCGSYAVTFSYYGQTVTYGTVMSSGKCWLDRNLGASQVATSSIDASAYGDLFEWGRLIDGHQLRTSTITSTLSNSNVPGHSKYIRALNSPYDWRSPQNSNLWQGVNGINNPCPAGFRLPTETEWDEERLSWGSNDSNGAYNSPLKLTVAGYRYQNGGIYQVGLKGNYWSSTFNGTNSRYLNTESGNASIYDGARANGGSVRCIED